MTKIYIKELETKEEAEILSNIPPWGKNVVKKLMKKINWIVIKQVEEDKKIYQIPNVADKAVYKKIRKKLEKEKAEGQNIQVVLAKKVKPYQNYLKGYRIVDGKQTLWRAIEGMIKKILQETPMALQDIYFLTNSYQEQTIQLIQKIAQKVKSVNIITKEIEKYKKLEEFMQEQGIAISVSNNKRKSIKKAKLIINLDFAKEELNEYTLFRNAAIINVTQEKIVNLKGFEGIIVQDIAIEIEPEKKEWIIQNNLEEDFRPLELYESVQDITSQKEDVQVSNLYGNNGKIDEKELRNWQKILTNQKN